MPEHEREARQIALLADYERTLATDPAATPPPALDPGLATVARLLGRELGGAQPTRAATPDAAFKAALRQRLTAQAAAQARPAVPPAMPVARLPGVTYRDRHIPPTPTLPPSTASPNGEGTSRSTGTHRAKPGTNPTARPRPLRAAFATGAGWLGAALVILIVLVAATLLMRGLPRTTPATQPEQTPSPVQAPTAPIPTSALSTATPPPAATPSPAAPLWQPTGAMGMPRSQHSATRLADGRVLVAGGYGNSGEGESSAELYDPRTGRWTPTGAMGVGRIAHTALLLPDGQVFVAGGFNNSVNHNTTSVTGAERYDPATGRWHGTAAPPVPLGIVKATLLANGQALLITSPPVGTPPDQRALTTFLYDPGADRWSSLGTLSFAALPEVIALADGRALLIGEAAQENDGTTPALILDPVTGGTTAAPLPDARVGFSANRLADGTVLVAGGGGWNATSGGQTTSLDTTLRFDPATGQWRTGSMLTTSRGAHTGILLADGRLLLVGGNNLAGGAQPTTAEIFDPQTDRWTMAGTLTSNTGGRFAVAPLADGRALVIGGDTGGPRAANLASVDLFTPPARQSAPTSPPPASPTPTTTGIIDWNSPNAGLLFYGGHGYRLRTLTLPDGTAPGIDQQIDTTVLRLQSGGVFEAGTPIYSVAGQSPDEWLALKDGNRVVTYQRNDSTTALLAGMQVVWGTVQDAGTTVCPAYGCPKTSEQQQAGTIATAYQVRIDRSLQGSLPPGTTIEVRQMGTFTSPGQNGSFAPLQPGDTVLLFLQPAQQQSIGDFGGGEYYWTTTGWIYHVVQGVIDPIGRSPDDFYGPPDRFEAAIAALFSNVTPLAPTDPRPTSPPVPTATRVAPTALPVATPTPTPRP
ncbi:MAG: kelch repeat-containing protein [Thermomicrobiales bacterium]